MKRHYVSYMKEGVEFTGGIGEILGLDLQTREGGRLEDMSKQIMALIRYCELLTDILIRNEVLSIEDLSTLSHNRFLEDVPITGLITSRNEE